MSVDWSKEVIDELIACHKNGEFYDDIADKLTKKFPGNKFSKSSVSGKVSRLREAGAITDTRDNPINASIKWDKAMTDKLVLFHLWGRTYREIARLMEERFPGQEFKPNAISGKVSRLRESGIITTSRPSPIGSKRLPDLVKKHIDSGVSPDAIASAFILPVAYVTAIQSDMAEKPLPEMPVEIPVEDAPKPVIVAPPKVIPAQVIDFTPPPVRQCEWREGVGKPWTRCTEQASYHTSWCNKHGRRVFNNWPPGSRKTEEKQYG